MGGEPSYAVTGVVNAGSYVVAVLCFRLQFMVSTYSADGWLEERPYLPGGEVNHTPSRMGISLQSLQWLRCGSGRGKPKTPLQPTRMSRPVRPARYITGAWRRVARVVSLIRANARSATPLYLGLSAGVNSCLIPRLRHSFPKSPLKHYLSMSDPTVITLDSVPSARTSVRNDLSALAAFDFLLRKYTRVNRVL